MIDADIFFSALFQGGYLLTKDWKNTSKETSYYNVKVECGKCSLNSIHIFTVVVIDKKHYVLESSVNTFIKRHSKLITEIFPIKK